MFTLSSNHLFTLKVNICFTLGLSGVCVRQCLNRANYLEAEGDDDESSSTEEGIFSSQCK